jgi:CRISPR/Cas system-associated exonuclease Cas4 (RecB family)
VSKDNQQLKEFVIDYDRGLAQSLLAELSDLKNKISSDIIPDRILTWPAGWQCQYCQFKEICKIAGEGEVKWSAFKKKVEN